MLGIVSYVFFIGKPPTGHGETLPTHLTLEWFILGIISPIKRHYIKLNNMYPFEFISTESKTFYLHSKIGALSLLIILILK